MEILKWYGIILTGFNIILQLIGLIFNEDLEEKMKYFLGIIFTSPVFIYLLMQ